jgi:hypothetical protein
MSQVTQLPLGEQTLGHFHLPFVMLQQLKHLPNMNQMLLISLTEYQNIIEEH